MWMSGASSYVGAEGTGAHDSYQCCQGAPWARILFVRCRGAGGGIIILERFVFGDYERSVWRSSLRGGWWEILHSWGKYRGALLQAGSCSCSGESRRSIGGSLR